MTTKLIRLTDAISEALGLNEIHGAQPISGILQGHDLRTIKGKPYGWTGEYRGHNDAGTFTVQDEHGEVITEQSGQFVYTGKNYTTEVLALLIANNKVEPVFVLVTT